MLVRCVTELPAAGWIHDKTLEPDGVERTTETRALRIANVGQVAKVAAILLEGSGATVRPTYLICATDPDFLVNIGPLAWAPAIYFEQVSTRILGTWRIEALVTGSLLLFPGAVDSAESFLEELNERPSTLLARVEYNIDEER